MAKVGDTGRDAMLDFEEFKVLANSEGPLEDVDWLDLASKKVIRTTKKIAA